MVPWRLAVCRGDRCREGGADAVFREAEEAVRRLGEGAERCRLARGGCYGLCDRGPNVVLRVGDGDDDPLAPSNYRLLGIAGEYHYAAMTPERLRRVLDEHVAGGRPVQELLGLAVAGRRG